MISAGQWTDGTHQALASGGLEDVFAQLRTQFDIIVVDSSPILPITDPLLIARNADGVIVALMQGVSRMPLANEAYRRLSVLGVRVLGAVVSGTPQRTYYGYGYNYASPVSA
jgi:Mrp family chromosome partitioning ATPase